METSRTAYRTAVPSLRASTMFLALSTASCCETVGWSVPSASWSSWTLRSPRTRTSRMRMRIGCARALKNSALKAWSCCAPPVARFMDYSLYKYILEMSTCGAQDRRSVRLTATGPHVRTGAHHPRYEPHDVVGLRPHRRRRVLNGGPTSWI